MAAYVGNNRATLVHGDYHPAALYKGNTRIAGWDESTKPLPATWENTYNDAAQVTISGTSSQQIFSGKNLFDGVLEKGAITNGINATGDQFRSKNYVSVTPGTNITISEQLNRITRMVVVWYDSSKTWISDNATSNTTFAVPANAYYMRMRCFGADYVADFNKFLFQIEIGSTKTEYEQYVGGIPAPNMDYSFATQPTNGVTITAAGQAINRAEVLRGMGDVRDTLDVTGGILTRRRGVKIFDGTETPGGFSERTNTVRVQYTITGKAANGTSTVRILSSHGCSTPDKYWSLDAEGVCELKNETIAQIIVSIKKTRLSELSANGVKAWVAELYAAGNPLTVEYDLAATTTESVTASAINSVQGGMTITAESNGVPVDGTATIKIMGV